MQEDIKGRGGAQGVNYKREEWCRRGDAQEGRQKGGMMQEG